MNLEKIENQEITPEELRKVSGYGAMSDEQLQQIVDSIKSFCRILCRITTNIPINPSPAA